MYRQLAAVRAWFVILSLLAIAAVAAPSSAVAAHRGEVVHTGADGGGEFLLVRREAALGYIWDAEIATGTPMTNAFDGFGRFTVNGEYIASAPLPAFTDGSYVYGQMEYSNGLLLNQKLTPFTDAYRVRFLNSVTNPTAEPITVVVGYSGNLGSDGLGRVRHTSSGDIVLTTADGYFVSEDDTAATYPGSLPDPVVTSAFRNDAGTVGATSVSLIDQEIFDVTFQSVTIAPGQTISFLFFIELNRTAAEAIAQSSLYDFAPADAALLTSGLTEAEIASVVNFGVVEVSPPEPVASVTLWRTGDRQVRVAWTASPSEGVTGYRIDVVGPGPVAPRVLPASARSATFSNLAHGTYTFTVSALRDDTASTGVSESIRLTRSGGGGATPEPTESRSTESAESSPSPSTAPPAPAESTATAMPEPSSTACSRPELALSRTTITVGETAGVSALAPPGSTVELFGYSRPSTAFLKVRSGVADATGVVTFAPLRPPTNTRVFARQVGCVGDGVGASVVLNVRPTMSVNARRIGPRTYLFQGDTMPARRGGLIVSLYRVASDGREVLTAQVRASATDGEWRLSRRFLGAGTFDFIVRTGQDLINAPGASAPRSVTIF